MPEKLWRKLTRNVSNLLFLLLVTGCAKERKLVEIECPWFVWRKFSSCDFFLLNM